MSHWIYKPRRGPEKHIHNAQLEKHELGFTTDTHKLFIGLDKNEGIAVVLNDTIFGVECNYKNKPNIPKVSTTDEIEGIETTMSKMNPGDIAVIKEGKNRGHLVMRSLFSHRVEIMDLTTQRMDACWVSDFGEPLTCKLKVRIITGAKIKVIIPGANEGIIL